MPDELPDSARFVAACFAAASVAPVPAAFELVGDIGNPMANALEVLPLVLVFGIPIALLHLGLLALPVYMLLRRWWRLQWWNAAAAGFVIGALPMSLLFWSLDGSSMAGLCGLVGGLTFWAVLKAGGNGPRSDGRDDLDEVFA